MQAFASQTIALNTVPDAADVPSMRARWQKYRDALAQPRAAAAPRAP